MGLSMGERDSGCGMAFAGDWAGVSVRVKVELMTPPRAWGMSQPASSASILACLPGPPWLFFFLLLLQEDGRGVWDIFGAPDIVIL